MTLETQALAFVAAFVYGNVFEYVLHRWVMHRPGVVDAAYRYHTLEHHRRFGGSEATFHLRNEDDREFLFFRPWMVAVVLGGHALFFTAVEWWTGWGVVVGGVLAGLAYYGLYEYVHFTFHTRGPHRVERFRAWQALKRHHLLHHRHHDKNLNVLFPLLDTVAGTRITADPPRRPGQGAR